MFVNIGCLYFVHPYCSVFSMGLTPHKAKQSVGTRHEFTMEKKKQRNIEGLSNDQKSQMHVYIALKKMYIVAQMKTIWRHRISQSSYTWKEVIGNFCTVVSPENVHISEGQKLHRGWEIMCVCMWHTQNRTFSKLTLKKSCAQTLSFLSFTCKFCKE